MSEFSSTQILEGVKKCVADSLAVEKDQLKEETLLIADLEADSLDIMDIMFQLEEEFSIKLQKEDFDFLSKIDMSREEALVDGILTKTALEKLTIWLPALEYMDPESGQLKEIRPSDLGQFLSIGSIVHLVAQH